MKRVMTMLAIAGLCSTGAAFAAQASTTPAPAKKEAKMAKPAPPTYTGCVAAGAKPNTYVLNDATATGGTDKASYNLKGGALKAHVGHKVEVAGSVKKATTGNSTLAVKKVTMVSASCA
jgi:hypothetical protein